MFPKVPGGTTVTSETATQDATGIVQLQAIMERMNQILERWQALKDGR